MSGLLIVIVILAAFVITLALSIYFIRRFFYNRDIRRRLNSTGKVTAASKADVVKSTSISNPILSWVQAQTLQADQNERDALTKDLNFLGFTNPSAPTLFVSCRVIITTSVPILFLASQIMFDRPIGGLLAVYCILGLSACAFFLPRFILNMRVTEKRRAIEVEFPDILDLMVICIESGSTFEGAISKVSRDIAETHPNTAAEMKVLGQEINLGRSRAEALRVFSSRISVDSINLFVSLIIQSEQLGASVGQSLRNFAAEMREVRYYRAEEHAMRIPLLVSMPLVLLMIPSLAITMTLPAVIDLYRRFSLGAP